MVTTSLNFSSDFKLVNFKVPNYLIQNFDCLSPLKLCHQLMVTGGFKDGTETVFGRRCSKGFA